MQISTTSVFCLRLLSESQNGRPYMYMRTMSRVSDGLLQTAELLRFAAKKSYPRDYFNIVPFSSSIFLLTLNELVVVFKKQL